MSEKVSGIFVDDEGTGSVPVIFIVMGVVPV